MSIVLILDNIRSCNNVGSIFRTADGCGIKQIWLTGITPLPTDNQVKKTALGAESVISWRYFPSSGDVLLALKNIRNKTIIAVEQTKSSVDMSHLDKNTDKDVYLIFGNEISGVSTDLINAADIVCELPMRGTKKSLNVSVCAGIIMYMLTT